MKRKEHLEKEEEMNKTDEGNEPVAQRQEMVSSTLALLGDLSAVVFEVSRASAPEGDEVL